MMYIHGVIRAVDVEFQVEPVYECTIRTPLIHIVKISFRSRMEALTEALKKIGLSLY